jgi:peptidoglycan/LPS O-acetylase OafA/YrhL
MVVVLSHIFPHAAIPGGSGVTIFFTISGFVITLVTVKEFRRTGGFSIKGFYLRRGLKILPPFVAIVAIPTLVYAACRPVDWGRFLSQVFFFYNWTKTPSETGVLPGSGVTWSLAIEEQFYIGFAALWLLLVFWFRRRAEVLLALGAAALCCLAILERLLLAANGVSWYGLSWWRSYYGTDTRLDSIGLGVVAAVVCHRKLMEGVWARLASLLRSDWVLLVAILLYLVSLVVRGEFFRDTIRYTMQSGAAVLIIVYGMLRPAEPSGMRLAFEQVVSNRLVQIIGLSSYSLYLVHAPIIHFLEFAAEAVGLDQPPTLMLGGIVLILAVSAGYLSWRFIELPSIALKRFFKSKAA